jgi:hypothetical protein
MQATCLLSMYVWDFLLSAIRMDIDNPGVTWDLDKTSKASNVSTKRDQIQPPP